jgi:REP element-mobilizing transposase RayT
MREPLAYHLAWTCYGQWLHGDPRGYVDKRHRNVGEPYPAGDPRLYNAAANRMAGESVWLEDAQRSRATAAIREVCVHRAWPLITVNVQPDHVHVAVRAPGVTGKAAMERIKSWASMQLNLAFARRSRWWTVGGKVELVMSEAELRDVAEYIENQRFPRVE